jgi:hypothetical protein
MEGGGEDELAAMTPAQRKLFELRMKVNAGRKANKQVRAIRGVVGWLGGWRGTA